MAASRLKKRKVTPVSTSLTPPATRTYRTIVDISSDGEKVIKRITQEEYDERYYFDPKRGLYYPSVNFVLAVGLPIEKHLIEWIASKGVDEAERVKREKGAEGSRTHGYVEDMINGLVVPSEGLSLKEKRSLLGFQNFWADLKPLVKEVESRFISEEFAVGGTIDFLGGLQEFDGGEEGWIIDWKTSKSCQLQHKVQVAVYAKCRGLKKAGVVTLGNTTKKRYTFTEVDVEKYFPYFLAAQQIFKLKYPNARPTVEPFPEVFSLAFH